MRKFKRKQTSTRQPSTKKPRVSRVPKTRGGGTYTEAGYIGFIRSGLRSKWVRWAGRYKALQAASRPAVGRAARSRFEYQCACCKGWFLQSQVEVDHLIPCGKFTTLDDLPQWVGRLFCEPEDLQVLCKVCHNDKTYNREELDDGQPITHTPDSS